MIEFTVLGQPVAKGRPKFRMFFSKGIVQAIVDLVRGDDLTLQFLRKSVKVSTYTPPETEAAQEEFGWQSKKFAPRKPLAGPLRVDTFFVLQAPASFPADRSREWPHIRPDDDNYRKLVLDALNEIFWHDDGQICAGESVKIYGHPPRTVVRISELTAADVLRVRGLIGDKEVQDILIRGING